MVKKRICSTVLNISHWSIAEPNYISEENFMSRIGNGAIFNEPGLEMSRPNE
jgi:hypothetical protein